MDPNGSNGNGNGHHAEPRLGLDTEVELARQEYVRGELGKLKRPNIANITDRVLLEVAETAIVAAEEAVVTRISVRWLFDDLSTKIDATAGGLRVFIEHQVQQALTAAREAHGRIDAHEGTHAGQARDEASKAKRRAERESLSEEQIQAALKEALEAKSTASEAKRLAKAALLATAKFGSFGVGAGIAGELLRHFLGW